MSVTFRKFITRVGQNSEFKPLKNQLLNYLKKESENKYKNYPRLLELMRGYWPKYKDRSRISHLLKDHHEEIFSYYLNSFFHFRKRGLSYEDPEAPTPVDFKLVFKYHYNSNEIGVVEDVMKELNIQGTTESILKRIFIFAISSFAYLVEPIFGRPFAFQFFDISLNPLPNDECEVVAIISGREQ
ncbi:MAG: hypothetical protein KGD65_05665 [Candidatus Lokiarchaeota archaeon]|nr:hypothetical protein [Candidatus Lokiarchaeota archaeon]